MKVIAGIVAELEGLVQAPPHLLCDQTGLNIELTKFLYYSFPK